MNARRSAAPLAALVATLAGAASAYAQVEFIRVRTGNGAANAIDQQVGVTTWGTNGAPPAAFTANDFAAARANRARVGTPPAGWTLPSAFVDSSAGWVGAGASGNVISGGKAGLYAIDFYVSHPNPASVPASLTYRVVASGALGGGPAQAVYINEQPIQFGQLGMSPSIIQTFSFGNVGSFLRQGRNTVYFTHVPGSTPAGLMITVDVQVGESLPCAPTWSSAALSGPGTAGLGGMVYDSARDRVVLYRSGGATSETWEFDGAAWSLRNTTSQFARSNPAIAYDAARQRTVLFGGLQSGGGAPTDVWEWDGTAWTQINAPGGPSNRSGAAAAYDAARGRVVFAGGTITSPVGTSAEVWAWNGSNWTALENLPGARADGGMAFDASTGRLIHFGGFAPSGGTLVTTNTTFAYDGTRWSTLSPAVAPSNRSSAALAYDSARNTVVLFGGEATNVATPGTTWELVGGQWIAADGGTNPVARIGAGLAYDSLRKRMVLFGGTNQTTATSFYAAPSLRFTTQPQPVTITENQSFDLAAAVAGTGPFSYRWRRNGQAIPFAANIAGLDGPAMSITNATRSDTGVYDLVVTSACGTQTSSAVLVQVNPCYANCDGSTSFPQLNAIDFSCFLTRYQQGCPTPR